MSLRGSDTMDSQTLMLTTIVAISLYLVGGTYSLYQYVQRKQLHKQNLEMLGNIFNQGVDVRILSICGRCIVSPLFVFCYPVLLCINRS